MKKSNIVGAGLAMMMLVTAAPAFAEDRESPKVDFYVGGQIGYHDLGGNDSDIITTDDGFIYGGYAGVDLPIGKKLIIGVEGNYNGGTGAINSEYGGTAKLGLRLGNRGQIFVRGGYQEVDVDIRRVLGGIDLSGVDLTDVDTTAGDYLVGVGAQANINKNLSIRVIVDTIQFDTARLTTGVAFHF